MGFIPKKKLLYCALSLCAVLLTLLLFGNRAAPSTHTIELAESGFYPGEIRIAPGDTVTFTTLRDKHFWPASDLHPTHTIYPEFDPGEPIPRDKSWSFTFKKAGKWSYHDHLFPGYRGAVIVGESKAEAREDCDAEKSHERKKKCWESALRASLIASGIDGAFNILAKLYETEPLFAEECHAYAHIIGESAYEKFAKKENFPVSGKTAYCGYGFYHGFMEMLFAKTGSLKEARNLCEYMETQSLSRSGNAKLACFHGIGHGLVDGSDERYWGNDQAMVEPALKVCGEISETEEEYYRCASGAFNSLSIAYISSLYGLSTNKEDPLWICREQTARNKLPCYTDMMVALMDLTRDDLAEAARFVETMAEKHYEIKAMETLSSLAVRERLQASSYDDVIKICRELRRPELARACLFGFAGGLMEFGPPEREHENGLKYCDSAAFTLDERDECIRRIIRYARSAFSTQKTAEICELLGREKNKFCSF